MRRRRRTTQSRRCSGRCVLRVHRPRRSDRRHRQRRPEPQAARIMLHERLRIGVKQRSPDPRENDRIARLRDREGDVVEGLAWPDRDGEWRGWLGGCRGLACADCPNRCGSAQDNDCQCAANRKRRARLTRKRRNSGHRWLYRRTDARLGFAFGKMQKSSQKCKSVA